MLTPRVLDRNDSSAQRGGSGIVSTGDGFGFITLAHEMGHTFGFSHSSSWGVAFGADPIGPGTFSQYGDWWDMMGGARSLVGGASIDRTLEEPRRLHFNGFFKWLAGWLPLDTRNARAGGTFRLYRHDAAGATGLRGILIEADAEKVYWLDARGLYPWNLSMSRGLEVRRVWRAGAPSSHIVFPYGLVELLDMDPENGGSITHSLSLVSGAGAFRDDANHVRIWVRAPGTDATGDYIDVTIER